MIHDCVSMTAEANAFLYATRACYTGSFVQRTETGVRVCARARQTVCGKLVAGQTRGALLVFRGAFDVEKNLRAHIAGVSARATYTVALLVLTRARGEYQRSSAKSDRGGPSVECGPRITASEAERQPRSAIKREKTSRRRV